MLRDVCIWRPGSVYLHRTSNRSDIFSPGYLQVVTPSLMRWVPTRLTCLPVDGPTEECRVALAAHRHELTACCLPGWRSECRGYRFAQLLKVRCPFSHGFLHQLA